MKKKFLKKYHSPRKKQKSSRVSKSLRPKLFLSLIIFVIFSSFFLLKNHINQYIEKPLILLSKNTGLIIKKVYVYGNKKTDTTQLKKYIPSPSKETPTFFININNIKTNIETFPWVKTAAVRRIWPDTLKIFLKEKEPLALWQKKGQLFLIDKEGQPISLKNLGPFRQLPLVVGNKANIKAQDLLEHIHKTHYLKSRIKSASFIQRRRWNLNLFNKITIQLPEKNWKKAIDMLEELHRKSKVLDKNLEIIDIRTPPQVILRLKPETAKRYKTINSPSLKKRPLSA